MTIARHLKFALGIKEGMKRFPTEDEWTVYFQGEFNMTLEEARWIAKRLEICNVKDCRCVCHRLDLTKEEIEYALSDEK